MSTGYRSRSLKAQSARELSGLNSVDTDWLAFTDYRPKLKQLANSITSPMTLVVMMSMISLHALCPQCTFTGCRIMHQEIGIQKEMVLFSMLK